MSHKVHPRAFRLGYTADWKSRWFSNSKKEYREFLEQDYELRKFIMSKLKQTAIKEIEINRSANSINIKIYSARPGIIIGRGGKGIQDLKKEIISKVFKGQSKGLNIDIEEIEKPEIHARVVALNIVEQLERRMPFRHVMKRALDKTTSNPEVKGAKISIAGRLGGTEMARKEWLKKGAVPLQTLRADIDYAQVNALTTHGVIGVKVWIYKGEKFK